MRIPSGCRRDSGVTPSVNIQRRMNWTRREATGTADCLVAQPAAVMHQECRLFAVERPLHGALDRSGQRSQLQRVAFDLAAVAVLMMKAQQS